jgi:hypothetical protein
MKVQKITSVFLFGFGLLTLFLSASIIFDLFEIRIREGNYVLFIVWANFICSFLYFLAAYGFRRSKKWTTKLLISSVLILIIALIGLMIHIYSGGLYETKTIGAMIFRTSITIIFTLISYYNISKKQLS